MRIFTAILIWLGCAVTAVAGECPANPATADERGALLQKLQATGDEQAARLLTNDMWHIWARAPDTYAQELLNEGIERRGAFDLGGARVAFDALVAYCPDYAEGYNQRGFLSYLQQEFDAAITDLDAAIARDPQHFAARAGRALSLIGLGRTADAEIALRAALRLNPWLPERHLLPAIQGNDL